jgi:hypothetical protein
MREAVDARRTAIRIAIGAERLPQLLGEVLLLPLQQRRASSDSFASSSALRGTRGP